MKKLVFLILFLLGALISSVLVSGYLKPQMNKVELETIDHHSTDIELIVALLTDIHISNNEVSINNLMNQVRVEDPDIILLGGDYIFDGSGEVTNAKRNTIAKALSPKSKIPVLAVMGNHESWSNLKLWIDAFQEQEIIVLHNEVAVMEDINLCVRGLGDFFTNQFEYLDFPVKCNQMIKITLTHDPAGAFDARIKGIVLAGHTHCGQINLPLFGPLAMPTDAPKDAHCGLYEDNTKKVYVSSGVGTSVIPIRFMSQASWDLITIRTR